MKNGLKHPLVFLMTLLLLLPISGCDSGSSSKDTFGIKKSDGTAVTASLGVFTITEAGEYTLSGTLSDGQVIIDAGDDDEITMILNGVEISCSAGAPIYIKNAGEVTIKSAKKKTNYRYRPRCR